MDLARFPRIRLAHTPTPLEPLANLTRLLGGPKLYIKRDDCTGLATGGNKTRKLEFLVADAIQQGADTLITLGAVQSNHVRQTAAAACKMGLTCEIMLERRLSGNDPDYARSGNVFLDKLYGATLHYRPGGADMLAEAEARAAELKAQGAKPYVIPGGGSNRIGTLGYVSCALELEQQANDAGISIDYIVHATGSFGTQAGLVAGLVGANARAQALGICVSKSKAVQEAGVLKLAEETADHVGIRGGIPKDAVVANSDYFGTAYGQPTPGMIEAVNLLARHEGILLDPVYTGKAMAGLIDLVRKGLFRKDQTVVFIHTGGTVGLFAYQSTFVEA